MLKLATILLQIWMPLIPNAAPPRTDTLSVCLLGDVMMHSRQMEYNCTSFLEDLEPRIRKADISIANMEFTLAGKPYTGYPCFSAPDEYASYIASLGTDVFLTANNHILDKGKKGMARTLDIYRSMSDSALFAGSGADPEELASNTPLIIFRKGIRLALINFTYGTNTPSGKGWPKVMYMNRDDLSEAIKRARQAGADFIIAIPHWGIEYTSVHSAEQEQWAEWLAGQGVSAIVGHHPHVVQDYGTTKNGTPVFYSLGNAVSNMSAKGTRLGLVVTLRFSNDILTGRKQMLDAELTPVWCTLPGKLINGYKTIETDKWKKRRADWIDPSDYDNMMQTIERSPLRPCICRTSPCK